MIIRGYEAKDNLNWVRCRVLSFLDTAYYDDVLVEKEIYKNPAIELVAEIDKKIVGIIDVEYEVDKGTLCYSKGDLGGIVWHLAVLPEYRNRGISTALLNRAIELLKDRGIKRLEAWTRDDEWVNSWYLNRNFQLKYSYLHVYINEDESKIILKENIKNLSFCKSFAHYTGSDKKEIKKLFKRVHDCNLYELTFSHI